MCHSAYDVVSISNHGNSCVAFSPEASITLHSLLYWEKSKAKRSNWRAEVQWWWCEDLTNGSVCFAGHEAPTSRSLISEFIRPLQISGDKPELLSVKPTFLTRSRAGGPARAFLSEVPTSLWLHHMLFQKQMSFVLLCKWANSRCCDWMQLELWWRRGHFWESLPVSTNQIPSSATAGVAQIDNPAGFDLGFNSNMSGDQTKHVDGVYRASWGFLGGL